MRLGPIVLGALLFGCGNTPSIGSDAGVDASIDACEKCVTVDADPGDVLVLDDDASSSCPPSPPEHQMCSLGSPDCTYTIHPDAGADFQATCTCVPAGEDSLAYQCAEPSSLCMDSSGTMDPSFKACAVDKDCAMQRQQTDCCGSVLFVGTNKASANQLEMCEVAWAAQFTPCSCTQPTGKTEDGNATNRIAPASSVHCLNKLCMTTTP